MERIYSDDAEEVLRAGLAVLELDALGRRAVLTEAMKKLRRTDGVVHRGLAGARREIRLGAIAASLGDSVACIEVPLKMWGQSDPIFAGAQCRSDLKRIERALVFSLQRCQCPPKIGSHGQRADTIARWQRWLQKADRRVLDRALRQYMTERRGQSPLTFEMGWRDRDPAAVAQLRQVALGLSRNDPAAYDACLAMLFSDQYDLVRGVASEVLDQEPDVRREIHKRIITYLRRLQGEALPGKTSGQRVCSIFAIADSTEDHAASIAVLLALYGRHRGGGGDVMCSTYLRQIEKVLKAALGPKRGPPSLPKVMRQEAVNAWKRWLDGVDTEVFNKEVARYWAAELE